MVVFLVLLSMISKGWKTQNRFQAGSLYIANALKFIVFRGILSRNGIVTSLGISVVKEIGEVP